MLARRSPFRRRRCRGARAQGGRPAHVFAGRSRFGTLVEMGRRIRRRTALLVFLASACNGESSSTDAGLDTGALTDTSTKDGAGAPPFACTSLSDPAQCWNRLARALYACLPTGVGTLDAARTECTYSDGSVVRFASAVPTKGGYEPRFTLLRPGGATCGSFDSGGFTVGVITSGEQTASLLQETGPRLRLTCSASGVTTTAFDVPYSEVSACAGAATPLVPPGYNALVGTKTVRIQIIADGNSASSALIDCASP